MPKWKQFVRGHNLAREEPKHVNVAQQFDTGLTGCQVKDIYESIINEPPSTSLPVSSSSSSTSGSKISQEKINRKVLKPKPSVNTLFSLCETNNIGELSDYFETYSSELLSEVNNITDEYGWTLLMSAACAGSNAVVEYLLEVGADWKKKDKKGLTAIELAKRKNKLNTCELIHDWVALNKKRKRNINSLTEVETVDSALNDQELSNNSGETNKKFCIPCSTEITSERLHNNCIAHLLSTTSGISDRVHYGLPESNKGFQLMLRSGWDRNSGLGSEGQGQKFPVKTILKRDRKGFGEESSKIARVTHFGPFDTSAVENPLRQKREKVINKELLGKIERKARNKEVNFRREFNAPD